MPRIQQNTKSNSEGGEINSIIVNEFTEYGVVRFKEAFDALRAADFPIIPIHIDSFGGEIYSLMAMLDMISASDRPVATIALGKAMSCGSVLLASGTKGFRFIGPHATVMIHDAATFSFGRVEELKAEVGEAERLNDMCYEILDTSCDQKNGYFKKIVSQRKHINWFLTPQEALKHKIVDYIGIPHLGSVHSLDLQGPNRAENNKKVTKTKKKKK